VGLIGEKNQRSKISCQGPFKEFTGPFRFIEANKVQTIEGKGICPLGISISLIKCCFSILFPEKASALNNEK
jgi:hypothetical protein